MSPLCPLLPRPCPLLASVCVVMEIGDVVLLQDVPVVRVTDPECTTDCEVNQEAKEGDELGRTHHKGKARSRRCAGEQKRAGGVENL